MYNNDKFTCSPVEGKTTFLYSGIRDKSDCQEVVRAEENLVPFY
jgi:hypothetical protein